MNEDREKNQVEIELKLMLPDEQAEFTIIATMRAHNYRVTDQTLIHNFDLYMDTFDWLLMKRKLVLRYRLANAKALYTIKSLGTVGDGIATRMEKEIPLKKPLVDPSRVACPPIREVVAPIIFPRKLLEQVQVRTERRQYRALSPNGAEFELAFDTSTFQRRGPHARRSVPKLHEMEAELIKGPETELRSLATLLRDTHQYQPSPSSKFEQALSRLKVVVPSKSPPARLRVGIDDRLDLVVQKILTYQFHRFREQLPGLKHDLDSEFVHQARVATRRMRMALRLFHDAVPDISRQYLENELKWLGAALGEVRDIDVFLLNLDRFQQQLEYFPLKKKKAFANWVRKQRRVPLKNLLKTLGSSRYRRFRGRTVRFCHKRLSTRPRAALASKTIREMAPLLIFNLLDAVLVQGQSVLAHPKLKEFHKLRIRMKQLRYACEFVAPAYNTSLTPFINRTVELQDCLGEIQDTVFTKNFIDSLSVNWKKKNFDPSMAFVLGEMYRLQTDIAQDRQKRFYKIWTQFKAHDTINQLKEALSSRS